MKINKKIDIPPDIEREIAKSRAYDDYYNMGFGINQKPQYVGESFRSQTQTGETQIPSFYLTEIGYTDLVKRAQSGDQNALQQLKKIGVPDKFVSKAKAGNIGLVNLLQNLPEGVSSQKLNFNLPGYQTAGTFNAERFKAPANAIPNAIAPMQFTGAKGFQQPQMYPNLNPSKRTIQKSFDRTMKG